MVQQSKPVIRFVTSEEWVEVYVNDTLFDANHSIGRLDVLGLLRRVGCVVQKVEATKPLRRRNPKVPPPQLCEPAAKKVTKTSAKPVSLARRKTKRGA